MDFDTGEQPWRVLAEWQIEPNWYNSNDFNAASLAARSQGELAEQSHWRKT
jgi:hypothetical protein